MDIILTCIGWFGSALLIASLLQRRMPILRVMNMAASAILALYNGAIEVWPMFAVNTAVVIVNAVTLSRSRLQGRARVAETAAMRPKA